MTGSLQPIHDTLQFVEKGQHTGLFEVPTKRDGGDSKVGFETIKTALKICIQRACLLSSLVLVRWAMLGPWRLWIHLHVSERCQSAGHIGEDDAYTSIHESERMGHTVELVSGDVTRRKMWERQFLR